MMEKTKIDNYAGFPYISLINVPLKKSKHGKVIDVDPSKLELLVSKAIIEKLIPIHGKELKFLRKGLGLSLEKFANQIGLASTSVFKWEKADTERLHPINEVAVRAFIAEKLGLKLSATFTALKGTEHTPAHIELKAS
jgi:DNA-binding transcriptional regulator YiaG